MTEPTSHIVTPEQEVIWRKINDPSRLVLSRVPLDIKERFIAMANAEEGGFCGDFGMLLKALVDGVMTAQELDLQAQIDDLNRRLDELSGQTTAPAKKISLLSGKTITRE